MTTFLSRFRSSTSEVIPYIIVAMDMLVCRHAITVLLRLNTTDIDGKH